MSVRSGYSRKRRYNALQFGATDSDFASVRALLHMDGADLGTTFTDQKGATVTSVLSARTRTTQFKYGTAALQAASAGSYIRLPHIAAYNCGSGNFTVECWAWKSSAGLYSNPVLFTLTDGIQEAFTVYGSTAPSTALNAYCKNTVPSIIGSIAGTMTHDTWHHVAYTRNGNTFTLWVDGVSVGTASSPDTLLSAGLTFLHIGYGPSGQTWDGYIDDFRLTVGVCRYTGTFTPPSAAFPNS